MGNLQPNSGAGKDRYIKQLEKNNDQLKTSSSELVDCQIATYKDLKASRLYNTQLLQIIKDLTTMLLEK